MKTKKAAANPTTLTPAAARVSWTPKSAQPSWSANHAARSLRLVLLTALRYQPRATQWQVWLKKEHVFPAGQVPQFR